jgi:dTMP kinase
MTRDYCERGRLIAFEGPDGSGKTTQRKLFRDWLDAIGEAAVVTKWSSSPKFKSVIKARKAAKSLDPEQFATLHAADFRYRYENDILPALREGKSVLADRYVFTGIARDAARGLDPSWSMKLYEPVVWPDLVFYFVASPETCARRIAETRAPKYYEAGQDVTGISDPFQSYDCFIRKVIREYEKLGEDFPFIVVDAEKPIYDQHRFIRSVYEEWRNVAPLLSQEGQTARAFQPEHSGWFLREA